MTRALRLPFLGLFCISLGFAGGALASLADRAKDQSRASTTIEKTAPREIRVSSECRSA